ncbi:tigger transposable element-derived protein 7-like [Procambarus clarkii]|uniref:tigger transposable element-derived protein 7-like n=1 Tax=Procambarus clarkii TaxID=6728 RepID=UPI00374394DE
MSQSSIHGIEGIKQKRKHLSIYQKVDLIEKAERGYSVTRLTQEFNIEHGAKGIAVSVDSIRNAAERLTVKLNIDNFKASTEWACKFKERYDIINKKICGETLSADVGNGSHRTKYAIVGKSANPKALKNCMNRLPVIYYNTKNARFTQIIFEDWFQNHFYKLVKKQQINEWRIHPAEVKVMLLTDNAPAHPIPKLTSPDGKITCMALPPNTTSVIQPMD